MLVFPEMIAQAAQDAGMKVPENTEEFDPNEYPHFQVFCNVQLGRPIQWGEHWENAKVIAAIPENKIRKTTLTQLISKGLQYQS
jgi:hypothetical protein